MPRSPKAVQFLLNQREIFSLANRQYMRPQALAFSDAYRS
jgi:hypothetical protein